MDSTTNPTWSDQVHQLALSLKPPQSHSGRWNNLPPAQDDQPLLLSMILESPLPQQRPGSWPELIVHLQALTSDRWELLIPFPAPTWLDELRCWMAGALRCFPELEQRSLKQEAHIIAAGHWLLPVNLNTQFDPNLLEKIEAYQCWQARGLLLGPDPVYLLQRQSLWQQNFSACLWISTPLILNPGRPLMRTPIETQRPTSTTGESVEELSTKEPPLQVLVDATLQPQRLLIQPDLQKKLGAEHNCNSFTLLRRAEALGIPAWIRSKQIDPAHSREGLPLPTLQRPHHWKLKVQSERAAHALVLPLSEKEIMPVQAQHWQLHGFCVLRGCSSDLLLKKPWLQWLTWLSDDSLISAQDLDQLRDPEATTLARLRDRGSGKMLLNLPTAEHPVGLTIPIQPSQPGSAIKLAPQSNWKRLNHVTIALDGPVTANPLARVKQFLQRNEAHMRNR